MSALPHPGDLFEGRYAIAEAIGRGGFASVFKAKELNTGRTVAIKILVPLEDESPHSARLAARFEREARMLAGLKSAHSVTMYDFGRSADGLSYIIFEYVNGTTLRELVETNGPIAPRRVVSILEQILVALEEAHGLGVLHRDIKPANIMVYEHLGVRDIAKLLDWGIAKPVGRDDDGWDETSITSTGAVVGTPRYMSPEQLANQPLAANSDIYSLGLVAFQMLTGDTAIAGETPTAIIRAQLGGQEIAFPSGANVPAGLRKVIAKMTRKSRSDRYTSAAEVREDLAGWSENDEHRGISRWAVAGIALSAALLGAAFMGWGPAPREAPAELKHEAVQLGAPLTRVSMATSGLTYFYLKSSTQFELRGTRDPAEISEQARLLVAVERDGAAIPRGHRWVADITDWDGQSKDYEFVAELIPEATFQHRAYALMEGVKLGRYFGRNVTADVVSIYLDGAK